MKVGDTFSFDELVRSEQRVERDSLQSISTFSRGGLFDLSAVARRYSFLCRFLYHHTLHTYTHENRRVHQFSSSALDAVFGVIPPPSTNTHTQTRAHLLHDFTSHFRLIFLCSETVYIKKKKYPFHQKCSSLKTYTERKAGEM